MSKLADTLVKRGLISRDQCKEAIALSKETYTPFSRILVENGFLPESGFLKIYAELHGMEFVDLKRFNVDQSAISAVSAKLASHYTVIPVKRVGRALTIAVSNPLDLSPSEDIETNLGFSVERVLACRKDIEEALQKHYGVGADTVERILAESPEREEMHAVEVAHDLEKLAEDASVVRLVNQLLQDAITDRATDIHFESHRSGIVTRRRIDGILYDTHVHRRIRSLYPSIVSRVKLMSGLDIVERRLPQDGRARVKIRDHSYDLRVSVVPAMHGEDIVIRILPSTMLFDLTELGFSDDHLNLLEGYIGSPHGILMVTGPTGSGKSTTLYACMSRLNTREKKIITIEDPIEYELPGITQTQINPKIGLTFARSLRSMLRHDPDVMMVGEIRDRETAEVAIQTAMTGHLVLTTLHTNDAAGGAARLIDMGIDPYLITSTVQAFSAQRLVRMICTHCTEEYEEEGRKLFRGKGCEHCNNSGFWGRVAICEFLPMADDIQELILSKTSALDIRKKADALGMRTLRDDGMVKASQGITTEAEVLRVTTA